MKKIRDSEIIYANIPRGFDFMSGAQKICARLEGGGNLRPKAAAPRIALEGAHFIAPHNLLYFKLLYLMDDFYLIRQLLNVFKM